MKLNFTFRIVLASLLFLIWSTLELMGGSILGKEPIIIPKKEPTNICFIENKGQVVDQYFKARPDVLFSGTNGSLSFHLKRTGISYQLTEITNLKKVHVPKGKVSGIRELLLPQEYTIHRVDLNWISPNEDFSVIKDNQMPGSNNYYTPGLQNGIHIVNAYEGIWIKNLYRKIDAHYYAQEDHFKCDYIVAPGANYKELKWQITGATLSIDKSGNLLMTTNAGIIEEGRPLVYQNNKGLKSNWIVEGNILSLHIDLYDPNKELIIDPLVRSWGSYYGGPSDDEITSCAKDHHGNLFVCGLTASSNSTTIATTGSHQQTFAGGTHDAFVAKIDPAGVRIWSTYYGGSDYEYAWGVACDNSNNIYLAGQTASADAGSISTVGSHQLTFGGNVDAFLVKFDNNGVRLWGTYYGDTGEDYAYALAIGPNSNPVIVGETSTSVGTSIATAGSHQPIYGGALYDAFVVSFNSSGVRQWGSYYGGNNLEIAYGVSVDNSNNIIFGGETATSTANVISTVGAHQVIHGGGTNDGFVAMFSDLGVRQWGTYYGGIGEDLVLDLCSDQLNNIIISGSSSTTVGTSIATVGSFQALFGGGTEDALVAKFSTAGVRQWGTYFGGSQKDILYSCDVDANDTIYVSGSTTSNNGIATINGYDLVFGGNEDATFAKFIPDGNLDFGSYYGGANLDISYGICVFPDHTIYLVGKTETTTDPSIATVGSHQPIFGGGTNDGFIVKIFPCDLPIITPNPDINACHNQRLSGINFTANIANATFKWNKKSSLGGEASTIPISGFGSIPSFNATNTTCGILVDSIIVTPINKLNPSDSCSGISDTFLIQTLPSPSPNQIRDSSFCHGQSWLPPAFTGACIDSVTYRWIKKSGPGGTTLPGLASSGVGNLPSLNIVNPPPSCLILTDTIYVTAFYKTVTRVDSCAGPSMKFILKSVPTPVVSSTRDSVYCAGVNPNGFSFTISCAIGSTLKWRKATVGGPLNSGTNLPINGNGSIPSFTTSNSGITILTDTIFANATFISVGDSCVGANDTFLIKVLPNSSVNRPRDTTYCHGVKVQDIVFTGPVFGATYKWTRSGVNIGIPASGTNVIPMFVITNTTNAIITNTITVTPSIILNGVECSRPSIQFTISVYPQPIARCKPVNVNLNAFGVATIAATTINNGSTGRLFSVSPSSFNCSNLGINFATLTVVDSCSNASTCVATITVRDLVKPTLFCVDQVVNLQPTSCDTRFYYVPIAADNCAIVDVLAQDTAKYGVGKLITPGVHQVCYTATDGSLNTSTCCITVTVNVFSNPVGSLACGDEIQISLDELCSVTLTADMFLKGGPYRCYEEYKILVQLWNGGPYIDRNLLKKGVQLSQVDIGHVLKVTIVDTVTGNSCWGKATVEDKQAPKLTCPKNVEISCDKSTDTKSLGVPIVIENCGFYTLNFVDVTTKGNCSAGVDHWIRRTWTAVDNSGNKSFCSQIITVNYANIAVIEMPKDYNGYSTPDGIHSLACDNRYNPSFNLSKHLKPSKDCIDDYLLDNVEYISSGRRVPKKLGWNSIVSGPYAGHPNVDPIYYPVHQDSSDCWYSNEIVMWEGTGTPKIVGCSNLGMSYSDQVLNSAKAGCNVGPVGCYKLLRTWTILDWCTNQIRTHQQIIKVDDPEGPEILFPDTLNLLANSYNCRAQWDVKDIWLSDNCSQDVHYTIKVTYGTVLGNENSGFVITDLPFGDQYIYIIAEDCCGNVTEKKVLLNVVDKTPPTAVCEARTVTSIIGNLSPDQNYSLIKANSFDDGSYDNCANQVYFKVIRMDELQGTNNGSNLVSNVCNNFNGDDNNAVAGSQSYFDDDVKFCCNDVGFERRIVFRVFDVDPGTGPINPIRMNSAGDLFGHFTDCMVEVSVQNKINPILVAPSDVVVSCDWWIDLDKLADPKDSIFGKMVNDLAWRKKVTTVDILCYNYCVNNPITKYPGGDAANNTAPRIACEFYTKLFDKNHPERKQALVWGFDGYILSGCGSNYTIAIDDQRNCGQGKIIRKYSTTGQNGQLITAQQTIWIVDCDPFYINSKEACDTLDDIVWPDCIEAGTFIYSCGANTNPDKLGRPVIVKGADDHCALIAIEYTDQIFTTEKDACFVILRKWVVIDWCQYDPNLNDKIGRWEFSQFIKIQDIEKPFVHCTIGACEPAAINPKFGTCYGHINLTSSAVDSCTPTNWLRYEYKIDLFNDGTIDFQVGSLNKLEFDSGSKPLIRNNPNADDENNPFNASGTYPIGKHRILWYVSDGCGNIGVCSNIFEVKDCKAPTPYCLIGIITVPMPSTGCIDIWAKDLNYGSYDNCTNANNLKFYFDGNPAAKSMRICCEDFVQKKINDELYISVQMWVEDEEGNKDYCNSLIIVQDNQNICPNVGTLVNISGELKTETGLLAAQSKVDLYTNGQLVNSKVTVKDGRYVFSDLLHNTEYMVKPTRNDLPVNGVSTADLVKIQKHILGKEMINSPYKLIAADVNNSQSITTSDVSEIRKLILGVIPNFTKVQSWKFIPTSTQFQDFAQPWNYTTEYPVSMSEKNATVDFVSIKMGDVNETAVTDLSVKSSSRTDQKLTLIVEDQNFEAEKNITIDFKVKDIVKLQGFQFTFHFNKDALKYENYESGQILLSDNNLGFNRVDEGILTMSWNSDQFLNLDPNQIIFRILFKTKSNSNLKNNVQISSEITEAEYYNADLVSHPIVLWMQNRSGDNSPGIFELVGVVPNPWTIQTDILFQLPEITTIKCTIYDATGRINRVIAFDGKKGLNTIKVNREELNGSGIYYYQLDSKDYSTTGKFVLLND